MPTRHHFTVIIELLLISSITCNLVRFPFDPHITPFFVQSLADVTISVAFDAPYWPEAVTTSFSYRAYEPSFSGVTSQSCYTSLSCTDSPGFGNSSTSCTNLVVMGCSSALPKSGFYSVTLNTSDYYDVYDIYPHPSDIAYMTYNEKNSLTQTEYTSFYQGSWNKNSFLLEVQSVKIISQNKLPLKLIKMANGKTFVIGDSGVNDINSFDPAKIGFLKANMPLKAILSPSLLSNYLTPVNNTWLFQHNIPRVQSMYLKLNESLSFWGNSSHVFNFLTTSVTSTTVCVNYSSCTFSPIKDLLTGNTISLTSRGLSDGTNLYNVTFALGQNYLQKYEVIGWSIVTNSACFSCNHNPYLSTITDMVATNKGATDVAFSSNSQYNRFSEVYTNDGRTIVILMKTNKPVSGAVYWFPLRRCAIQSVGLPVVVLTCQDTVRRGDYVGFGVGATIIDKMLIMINTPLLPNITMDPTLINYVDISPSLIGQPTAVSFVYVTNITNFTAIAGDNFFPITFTDPSTNVTQVYNVTNNYTSVMRITEQIYLTDTNYSSIDWDMLGFKMEEKLRQSSYVEKVDRSTKIVIRLCVWSGLNLLSVLIVRSTHPLLRAILWLYEGLILIFLVCLYPTLSPFLLLIQLIFPLIYIAYQIEWRLVKYYGSKAARTLSKESLNLGQRSRIEGPKFQKLHENRQSLETLQNLHTESESPSPTDEPLNPFYKPGTESNPNKESPLQQQKEIDHNQLSTTIEMKEAFSNPVDALLHLSSKPVQPSKVTIPGKAIKQTKSMNK